MAKKQMMWKTKGMNQDLSVSAFNPEFSFENMNLRLSTNEGNTLLSWVNEKGTKKVNSIIIDVKGWIEDTVTTIHGIAIGTAIMNSYLVIFTHETINDSSIDRIYRIQYISNGVIGTLLYKGDLGFSTDNPIETQLSYESDNIQKVYWVDGKNQPRIINIAPYNDSKISKYNDTSFNFISRLKLEETVTIEKIVGGGGTFASGVIQYAFTYYNKYGQESNIFYTSPLLYVSYIDRGASPEDRVDNVFKITVNGIDDNYDYLRIYSIQRTSINAVPFVKRVQDIAVSSAEESGGVLKIIFSDNGTMGNTVEPTELLYKGGESIIAKTIEQKDNTLFLGNLRVQRKRVENIPDVKSLFSVSGNETRVFKPTKVYSGFYDYSNQLTSKQVKVENNTYVDLNNTVPCGGFKTGDYYRCGIQFQHETGKWSDPIFIEDEVITARPSESNDKNYVIIPRIKGEIDCGDEGSTDREIFKQITDAGYKKVRPVVVFPTLQDREIICQGVTCPTVYTENHRDIDKDIYAQSSWFFRPIITNEDSIPWYYQDDEQSYHGVICFAPKSGSGYGYLNYTSNNTHPNGEGYDPSYIRRVEIEGEYEQENKFRVDRLCRTLHSPDVEFDTQLAISDFVNLQYRQVGKATFINTLSNIDIQTETATIANNSAGFVHKSFVSDGAKGIVSGLFYDDYIVDDYDDGSIGRHQSERASVKWLIYPWQGNGSLNNDILRPSDKGNQTALLKKKILSNLRYATTAYTTEYGSGDFSFDPKYFGSDEDTALKLSFLDEGIPNIGLYKGNIDTMLLPDHSDGVYYANACTIFNNYWTETETPFDSIFWQKTFSDRENDQDNIGLRRWRMIDNYWLYLGQGVGNIYLEMCMKKLPVRMKYKSTPHLLFKTPDLSFSEENNQLAIFEILRKGASSTRDNIRFGGKTKDALMENKWVPCGEPVSLVPDENNKIYFFYDYGDTYYQRYDCLKTYAYTKEDPNQIVEIGSFMLEGHTNIDGRYDKNRAQQNNLNMSPQNFNLINPVYSQVDNFFTYRIMDDSAYEDTTYINQITWTKTKDSGADVDLWTNITMASVLELDGDRGAINSLNRLNDQLICFQDSGISQILYNENVQVSSSQGVPIEIANSGKVDGKRYLSNTVGCSNKWAIATTPNGIYFIDSNDKSIYLFNGQLQNISVAGGFNSWCKRSIPSSNVSWTPTGFGNFVVYYDKKNQDVLWINALTALAFSERLQVFTSFYDYNNIPYLCNLDERGFWLKNCSEEVGVEGIDEAPHTEIHHYVELWEHQEGSYGMFFGTKKPYWMTLVGNPEPQIDKIFTNIEFRASVDGDGELNQETGKFTPALPFDSLEVWNEYQHGTALLQNKSGSSQFQHHTKDNPATASLKRKFRIWRCDIPRDNAPIDAINEARMGIYRKTGTPHYNDRMRNPWLYLKLKKNAATGLVDLPKAEVHDLMMTYFD